MKQKIVPRSRHIAAAVLLAALCFFGAKAIQPRLPNGGDRSCPREFLFGRLASRVNPDFSSGKWPGIVTENRLIIKVFSFGWLNEPPGGYTLTYNRLTHTLSGESAQGQWREFFVGADELQNAAHKGINPDDFPAVRDSRKRAVAFTKLAAVILVCASLPAIGLYQRRRENA